MSNPSWGIENSLSSVPFIVGPLGGMYVGPVAVVLLVIAAIRLRRRWPLWVGGGLGIVLAGSVWLYWRMFWRSWDYLDGAHPTRTPVWLDVVENTALAISVLTCLALVATAVYALTRSRKRRIGETAV